MTPEAGYFDSIESQRPLDEVELPSEVAERLATLYGTAEAPRTVGAWVDEVRTAIEDALGRPPSVDDLCTTDDGSHAFVGDGEHQEYVCVLDPLAYAFLTETPGTVRSTTPVRGAELAIEVDRDGIDVSSSDAVVSIGVSDAVDADADPTLDAVYREVCEYVHLFADRDEYEAWAADAEAATTSVPAETGVALAHELAAALFDGSAAEADPIGGSGGEDCC